MVGGMHGRGLHGRGMHGRGVCMVPTVDRMTDACKNIKPVPFCNDLMLQMILRPQIVLATRH